jgi:PPP family 3-phenylpropionic acid transporter
MEKTGTMNKTPDRKFQLALQYFLYYSIVGIHLPYLQLFFREQGFSGREIGTLSSLRTICIIFFPLFWGMLADRFRMRKTIYVMCNVSSSALWGLYLITSGFAPTAAVTFAFAAFYSPIISFLEAFSMDILGPDKKSYGRIRLWGSISFVTVVLVLGKVISETGIDIIIVLSLGMMLFMSILSCFFPKTEVHGPEFSMKSALSLLRRPDFLMFLSGCVLMLASHGAYYGFLSIKLSSEGASASYIGIVWAVGSASEILVMMYSKELFRHIGIRKVLVWSFAFAAVRWLTVCYLGHIPFFMILSQLLHAVTYGCFHMACILFTDRVSDTGVKTLAQSVNNAVSYGLGLMAGIFTCGFFYDRYQNLVFLGCSLTAVAGGFIMKVAMKAHESVNSQTI